jgi:hypothetical protein
MGAVEVVVVRELHQDSAQVPLVDDEQVITALSSERANEPLGSQILSGLKTVLEIGKPLVVGEPSEAAAG